MKKKKIVIKRSSQPSRAYEITYVWSQHSPGTKRKIAKLSDAAV